MVTGVIPSPPRFLPSFFIAHRVHQSHCSSIVHRMLLTHALALSASQFVHKKKAQQIYTSMHSAGLELTKLTYTRLEDNLIRHRGDRYNVLYVCVSVSNLFCLCESTRSFCNRLSAPHHYWLNEPCRIGSHDSLVCAVASTLQKAHECIVARIGLQYHVVLE